MAFKFVIFSALVAAVANAGAIPVTYQTHDVAAAPLAIHSKIIDADHDPHPRYNFAYDVHDSLTGDVKSQHETRDGDVVSGSYSVVDPDGTKRTVEYTADPHNGFNAVVHREPLAHVVKTVAAAPTLHAYHETIPAEYIQKAHYAHHEPLGYAAPAIYAYHH